MGWKWAQRTLENQDKHAQSKVSLSFRQLFALELESSSCSTGQYFAFLRKSSAHLCTELCHFLLWNDTIVRIAGLGKLPTSERT